MFRCNLGIFFFRYDIWCRFVNAGKFQDARPLWISAFELIDHLVKIKLFQLYLNFY